MLPAARSVITELLESSRQDLLAATAGLTEEQAALAPAPDRWSILGCVEHVVVCEHRYLDWLATAEALDSQPDPAKETDLFERMRDRSRRAQAPGFVHPAGRHPSLADALEKFNDVRNVSVHTAEIRAAELFSLATKHPFFGQMNGAELMHIIAAHSRRHAAQIRETRELLKF